MLKMLFLKVNFHQSNKFTDLLWKTKNEPQVFSKKKKKKDPIVLLFCLSEDSNNKNTRILLVIIFLTRNFSV